MWQTYKKSGRQIMKMADLLNKVADISEKVADIQAAVKYKNKFAYFEDIISRSYFF